MKEDLSIVTFKEFNDYYKAANTPMRSKNDEFHVFRFSELGDELVSEMGPFNIAFFQFAIGNVLHARVGVFDQQEDIEEYTMVIYLPGQILTWEKTGNWDGYVIHVKESFLNLSSIAHLTDSFSFLHSVQPMVIALSQKEYKQLSHFFELMLKEKKPLEAENVLVVRNLLQVMIVHINRIISESKNEGKFVALQFHKIATRFKSLVLEHFQKHKTVTFYADQLGISPVYLGEVVKNVFGTSPKGIINEVIFLYAKTLLSSTDITIKELAWKLNYDDYSHFVKFFRKMSGHTPAAFRKSLYKEN